MLRTRTAEIVLHDQWCVLATIDANARQTVDDARENLAATATLAGDGRRPLLVDISRAAPLDPEVRHFYTGTQLVAAFHALGLLVEATPFGHVMGNIYLRVARPGIPTRLFVDRTKAFAWLRGFAK